MGMEIRPMVYRSVRSYEVLAHDTYKDYEFAIISLGTHPCAYVGIPKGHRFYKKKYSDKAFDSIPAHGGLTYSEMGTRVGIMQNKWVIGWDYSHFYDYVSFPVPMEGRRWTTEEILEDVKAVIDEITKGETR